MYEFTNSEIAPFHARAATNPNPLVAKVSICLSTTTVSLGSLPCPATAGKWGDCFFCAMRVLYGYCAGIASHGSWFMVHGSWFMVHGSWFIEAM